MREKKQPHHLVFVASSVWRSGSSNRKKTEVEPNRTADSNSTRKCNQNTPKKGSISITQVRGRVQGGTVCRYTNPKIGDHLEVVRSRFEGFDEGYRGLTKFELIRQDRSRFDKVRDMIGGCGGVLEQVLYEEIRDKRNTRGKNKEIRRDRTRTRRMTWTQGERTPESDTNDTTRWGTLVSWLIVVIVNNTKYIRNVKDMKKYPNKEMTPCAEQWSRCNYLKGTKYDR
jgi:hypothetical protein